MSQSQKENKQQIKKLIELNDELENYFKNTIIPQLFVDANLILRKFTPPAMQQFEFTPEHIGRPLEEMVDNIRYSTIIDDILQVIASGEILEKEIQTTDMSWYEMNIIPYIIAKENRSNGVIITFVDITGRIKVLKELENLNASHETFIYSVSHDLKGPLANMEGLIKRLVTTSARLGEKRDMDIEQQQVIAGMLDTSVQMMRNIVDELTEIARIEGNYKEFVETVNFESIIKEVDLILRDKVGESKAVINLDIQEAEIEFSRKNLRSIIYNLLSNAIKYKSPDRTPHIEVKTVREKEYVRLSVKDNGLGIAEDKKGQVFEQFSRIEKHVEGTGIGLYLVRRIVENAGGKIVLESKLGEGSEFIVYLKHKLDKIS
jgi:two-component system phosphate regulon sensor histidine kinase PhoR